VPKGVASKLSLEEGLAASTMVFREAAAKYGICYNTWRQLRENKGMLPFKGGGLAEEVVGRVLEDVRTFTPCVRCSRPPRERLGGLPRPHRVPAAKTRDGRTVRRPAPCARPRWPRGW